MDFYRVHHYRLKNVFTEQTDQSGHAVTLFLARGPKYTMSVNTLLVPSGEVTPRNCVQPCRTITVNNSVQIHSLAIACMSDL